MLLLEQRFSVQLTEYERHTVLRRALKIDRVC